MGCRTAGQEELSGSTRRLPELSKEELRRIFDQEVVPEFLVPGRVDSPILTIVGGQQGSGKSTIINRLMAEYPSKPQTIILDNMLSHIDGYDTAARANSLDAQQAANGTLRLWGRWFLDRALDEGNNILFEVASGDFKTIEDIKTSAHAAGYRTALTVVARPDVESWFNVVDRYDRMLNSADGQTPRLVLRESHDTAYHNWPGTIARQEMSDERFGEISIVDGEGKPQYSWAPGGGQRPNGAEALILARAEPISPERIDRLSRGWDQVLSSAALAKTVPDSWSDFEADELAALNYAQEIRALVDGSDNQAIEDWSQRVIEACNDAVGQTLLPEFGERMNRLKDQVAKIRDEALRNDIEPDDDLSPT